MFSSMNSDEADEAKVETDDDDDVQLAKLAYLLTCLPGCPNGQQHFSVKQRICACKFKLLTKLAGEI